MMLTAPLFIMAAFVALFALEGFSRANPPAPYFDAVVVLLQILLLPALTLFIFWRAFYLARIGRVAKLSKYLAVIAIVGCLFAGWFFGDLIFEESRTGMTGFLVICTLATAGYATFLFLLLVKNTPLTLVRSRGIT